MEEAKELMRKCAEKRGNAYVEKVDSQSLDVKCIYESDEAVFEVVELPDVKQTLLDRFSLNLPPEMSEDMLGEAEKRLDEFRRFVEKCVSRGGEVRLVKTRVGEPLVETVDAECWKVEAKD